MEVSPRWRKRHTCHVILNIKDDNASLRSKMYVLITAQVLICWQRGIAGSFFEGSMGDRWHHYESGRAAADSLHRFPRCRNISDLLSSAVGEPHPRPGNIELRHNTPVVWRTGCFSSCC